MSKKWDSSIAAKHTHPKQNQKTTITRKKTSTVLQVFGTKSDFLVISHTLWPLASFAPRVEGVAVRRQGDPTAATGSGRGRGPPLLRGDNLPIIEQDIDGFLQPNGAVRVGPVPHGFKQGATLH